MRISLWFALFSLVLSSLIVLSYKYSLDKRILGPFEVKEFSWEEIQESDCFKIVSSDGTWYVELLKKNIDQEHHLINLYVPFGSPPTFSKVTANTKKTPDERLNKYYTGKVKLCPFENQRVEEFNPN